MFLSLATNLGDETGYANPLFTDAENFVESFLSRFKSTLIDMDRIVSNWIDATFLPISKAAEIPFRRRKLVYCFSCWKEQALANGTES